MVILILSFYIVYADKGYSIRFIFFGVPETKNRQISSAINPNI